MRKYRKLEEELDKVEENIKNEIEEVKKKNVKL